MQLYCNILKKLGNAVTFRRMYYQNKLDVFIRVTGMILLTTGLWWILEAGIGVYNRYIPYVPALLPPGGGFVEYEPAQSVTFMAVLPAVTESTKKK